ncbi:MAG: protein translocase subunit SecD, partial [Bacteroidota bacterium]
MKALQEANRLQTEQQDDYVTLFEQALQDVSPDLQLNQIFHSRENKDKFARDASNEEILSIIREEADAAVSRTEQVLRKRIDGLGVVQPKIQRQAGTGRIIVELPGVKDKKRVRDLLQATARLEFWETYENIEILASLEQVNALLAQEKAIQEVTQSGDTAAVEEAPAAEDAVESVAPDTGVAPVDTAGSESLTNLLNEGTGTDSLDKLIGEQSTGADSANTGTLSQEEFAKKYPLYTLLSPAYPDQSQPQADQLSPVIGAALVTDTAAINKFLARDDVRRLFPNPRKIKFLWASKPYDDKGQALQLHAIQVTSKDNTAPLEGDAVIDARVVPDPLGRPEVSITMNGDGADKWFLLTKENVGEFVAIVLDDLVYSAPKVNFEISGGQSVIQGQFTQEEAADLANVLKAGKLPAPAKIINEVFVGPTLGQRSVNAGLVSFLVALAIILIYMFFYYSRAGAIADVALFANIFFVLGVLTSWGATLTLPGIAGIVLTIGMSVDANVLIYERIREELTQGKGLRLAIVDGYKNAYSSIIDANVTTLLTAIVLYVFGSGPIRGFATTLFIGILTSLFSAIFITRLLFEWQLSKNNKVAFSTRWTDGAFKNLSLAFVGKRKMYYVISGIIILLGFGSFAMRGLNLGATPSEPGAPPPASPPPSTPSPRRATCGPIASPPSTP